MPDDAGKFSPPAPGGRPAPTASGGKKNNHSWLPILVPEGVLLPDGKVWPELGMPFPWHPLGKPTAWFWFHDAAGQVVGAECRFEIDEPADANSGADANGAAADASITSSNQLIQRPADAADDADAKFPHLSGATKRKKYRPLVYCRRDDGRVSAWRWQAPPRPYPLFNLPRLIAERTKPVLITEGARKAVAAAELFPNFVATAMLFGAQAPAKSDCSPLAGRDCVIWPDHDTAGLDFAREVAALFLKAGAASVRMVMIPDWFPPKWDLCDPLPEGVTVG